MPSEEFWGFSLSFVALPTVVCFSCYGFCRYRGCVSSFVFLI